MAVTADLHMHSHHSGDSDASMDEMAEAALRLGLRTVCFTEHHDPDFPVTAETPKDFFLLQTDAYLEELRRVQARFQGRLDIRFGAELGLQPRLAQTLASYAASYPFDFLIGSTHLCQGQDVYDPSFFEGKTDREAYRAYFEDLYENVRACRAFDVCGHLDYVVRYGKNRDADYHPQEDPELFDRILRCLIERGQGLEVNTGGLKKGMREPHPCLFLLKRYRQLGGEIVTVGSDAHAPGQVGGGFAQAAQWLQDCGFRYYCVYRERRPQFLKL